MIKISNPGSVVYPNKFKAGDKAKALNSIEFCDGTWHKAGQIISVTENNVSYYNVFHAEYEKMGVK